MKGSRSRCTVFVCLALIASGSLTAQAQTATGTGIPGPNVNIIGPTPSPLLADTTLKQQNEPSCAVQPASPQNIFCAYNDYRGVDYPGVLDAWIGASMTRNDGLTWTSRLVPGFRGDGSLSLNQEFAADPVVAAAPGMVFINFIAANRDLTLPNSPPSGLYLQRWAESNKEDGAPWEFVDTKRIASGVNGSFLDKPVMVVTVKDAECDDDNDEDDDKDREDHCATGQPVATTLKPGLTKMVVPSVVHVAYAEFTGNQEADTAKIYYVQSKDLGASWGSKKELSLGAKFNQGVALATMGDRILAVWRQFASGADPNTFVYSISKNGGTKWSAPAALPLPAGTICPFDQPDELPDANYAFRSKALPALASDGKRLYVFWAQRTGNCATGQSRIAYLSTDGNAWDSTYKLVDQDSGHPAAHQAMPAAIAAGGVIQVAWVDTRDDEYLQGGSFVSAYIVDTTGVLIDADNKPINRRHTADIFHAQIVDGASRGPVKVSQYAEGDLDGSGGSVQLERNYANPRLFKQATKPFNGDYISAAAPAFRRDATGAWVSNHPAPAASDIAPKDPSFQLAWADNRDVRSNVYQQSVCAAGAKPGTPECPSSSEYHPAVQAAAMQSEAGSSATGKCEKDITWETTPDQLVWTLGGPQESLKALSRNQNVYSSVIKPGVVFRSASAAKPTNIQRAFVVYLQNTRASGTATFDLKLSLTYPGAVPSPTSDRVSFTQSLSGPALQNLLVEVPNGSSAARTVFVTASSVPAPNARVDAYEVTCANPLDPNTCTEAFASTIVLTGDPAATGLQNPDCSAGGATGTCPNGTQSVQLFEAHNPDLTFALYSVENPSLRNPSLRNPSLRNYVYENPSLRNQTVEFPSLRNPSLRNSPVTDSEAQTTPFSDFVYDISNTGNTTSAYNLKPLITGEVLDANGNPIYKPQLIVSRVYREETAQNCDFVNIDRQQVIINIPNPDVAPASTGDPLADPGVNAGPEDATFFVEPGGRAQITLRVWGVDAVKADPDFKNRVWMAAYSQSLNTDGTTGKKKSFDAIGCTGCAAPDVTDPVFAADPGFPLYSPQPANRPYIEANKPGGWQADYRDPAISDASPTEVTCTPRGVVLPVGPATVVCTATDEAGNSSSSEYQFAVVDETAPVVTVVLPPGGVGGVEATSASGAVVTFTASADDFVNGPSTPTCTPASGSMFPIGPSVVTCSATDPVTPIGGGNNTGGKTGSSTFTVTVQDKTQPVLSNVPASVTVEATSAAGATFTYASPTALDTVDGAVDTVCSPLSGSVFALGVTTVNCTATDTAGNTGTASFTVTVRDTTKPTVTPPANITAEATSAAGALVTFSATATDIVDGTVAANCTPASGNTFALGTTPVSCSASDAAGNTGTGSFTVTVVDTTKPAVTPLANITAEATSAAGALVTFSATATDIVDGAVAATCTPASGSTFAIGVKTVTCTATDAANNIGSASFTVTVSDTTKPVVTVPANLTKEATSAAGAAASFTASATDLGSPVATTCTPASGSTFAIGVKTVTCTATDAANNIGSASFTVTVVDTTPPVLTLPGNQGPFEATGPSGKPVTFTATALDVVSGSVPVTCAPASGSNFAIGATTVNCSATDGVGKQSSGSFTVTVRDTTAPSLTVPANITKDATGSSGAVVTYTPPSATDLVDTSVTLVCTSSPTAGLASGSTFPIGTTSVSCTATDDYNNKTTKGFTVTVNKAGYAGLDGVYGNGPKSCGSAVPLDFGFTGTNGARVDSSLAKPSVLVYYAGKSCPSTKPSAATAAYPSYPAGGSDYRYSASGMNWQFNWKPSVNKLGAGCYYIAVKSDQTNQLFDSTKGPILLTK